MCQNRRSHSVISRWIMRSRALRRSCNIRAGKLKRATATSKFSRWFHQKSVVRVSGPVQSGFLPGYVNTPRWLPVVAVRGSSATQTPEGSSRQVQQRRVPEMMKGTGLPPGLSPSPVRATADGRAFFCGIPFFSRKHAIGMAENKQKTRGICAFIQ